MDLRRRILVTHDQGHSSREEVARRYQVSLGMVKKLIQQRRHCGDIAPRYHRCGRKPLIVAAHQQRLRTLLVKKPDLTLAQLREALALECSLSAIHLVLVKMGLSYKKRRSAPASKIVRTSRGRAAGGATTREA
jgi:transposase